MTGQPVAQPSRFEIRGRLGQGGMGVVFHAYDRERRAEVALKTMASVDADSIYRFKNEFRALADLSHPNLVVLHELFQEGTDWYFTMELINGVDFLAYVRGADRFRFSPTAGPAASSAGQPTRINSGTRTKVPQQPGPTGRDNEQTVVRAQPALPPKPAELDATVRRAPAAHSAAPGSAQPGPDRAGGREKMAPSTLFDEKRLRPAFRQLVEGVHALHAAGKLHADLKPGNVLVTKEGRVVLLDFGLARARTPEDFYDDSEHQYVGTPLYMAPEQHAGSPSSEASDWFAVGVMLYESLTGQHPFRSLAILARSEPFIPPLPEEIVANPPAELAKLAMRLISWKPDERPRGQEILRLIGADTGPALGAFDPSTETTFVGRSRELKTIEDAFASVARGRPARIQVHGTSGFGKTTLIRHFLARLRNRGDAVVLTGRCYERESVPYKVFDNLIDALTRYLNSLTRLEVEALLPRDVRVLAKLFPALLRVRAIFDAPQRDLTIRDPQELMRRATTALKELFGRIADRKQLVLFIDDLQWGDLDSSQLLAEVVAPPDPPRMLLIVSYRTEEVATNRVLQTLLRSAEAAGSDMDVHEIVVGPLAQSDARELALRVLGSATALNPSAPNPLARAETIANEADGSPFFVQQLAQYLATGASATDGRGVHLGDVISARLDRLSDPARRLLNAVAVAGKPISQDVAVQAAEIEDKREEALQLLRSNHFVRTSGARKTDSIETYHDRIRESVVSALPASRVVEVSRGLAVALEGVEPLDADALTVHWRNAGEPKKAAQYAAQAAKQAADALAFDRAAELYRLALEVKPADDPERRDLQIGLADALRNAGRGRQAADAYLIAAEDADSELKLELRRHACEQLLVSGHIGRGREVAETVLAAVGLRLPSTPLRVIVALLMQRARVTLRGTKFEPRDEASIPRDQLALVDTCWAMSAGLTMFDAKLGAVFTSRYLVTALELGEPRRIAKASALEATHQMTSGNVAAAQRFLRLSEELVAQTNDDHALGVHKLSVGTVEYFQGHWRTALTYFDESLEIFRTRCTGVAWEIATAHFFAMWSLVYLGDWTELQVRAPSLVAGARQLGNLYLTHGLRTSAGITIQLMQDDAEGAERELREASEEWVTDGYQLHHFLRMYMAGWIDLYAGQPFKSWERIQRQWPALRRSLLTNVDDLRLRALQIRAFSAVAAAGSDPRLLRAAERDAKRIARIKSSFGSEGIACIVRGAVALKRGKRDQARQHLERAAAVFDEAEMRLFAAAARRRIGEILGGDAGKKLIEDADALFRSQNVANPERWADVLAPGFRATELATTRR